MSTTITPAMRRSFLIAALRDKTMWPSGFKWDFSHCNTCGIGLFRCMDRPSHLSPLEILTKLGIDWSTGVDVFGSGYMKRGILHVTPEIVADRLEEIHRAIADV